MRLLATLALLALLAAPAGAVVVHDESVNGDLSTDPANPTLIDLTDGNSIILGTTGNSGGVVDRDYITFTINSDRLLSGIVLHGLSPDNIAFCALNSGSTSFVPGAGTAASFLSGIHITASDIETDLLQAFWTRSVTGTSLSAPYLGAGTYCFLIQQTSAITQSYSLEFINGFILPAHESSWGAIKSLYR